MAEYYSANLAREVRKGLNENALQCKHTGGYPPFGYKVNKDKTYSIDENEAIAVKKIFEMVCNLETSTDICKWLTDNHYFTRNGNNFTKSALTNIIPNEKYKGVYVYNKYTRKKINGVIKDIRNNENGIVRVVDGIQRIISDEMWEKANIIFKQRKRTGRPANERVYLLSGLIFCGICGNHMIGEHTNARGNRQARTIYNCRGKKVKNTCELKAIRKDIVENIVIEMLNHALNEHSVKIIVDNLMAEINGFNKGADRELDILKGAHMSVNNKLNKIIDVMLETGTTPTLTEKLKQFEAEKEDIESKIKFHNEKNVNLACRQKSIYFLL